MNRLNISIFSALIVLSGLFAGCGNDDDGPCSDLGKVGGLISDLAFPVDKDVELGYKVALQCDSIYAGKILPYEGNEAAYDYLNAIKDELLASEDILYRDKFEWELSIIDDDVLNAFAAPGGYIYVYTGLIKYLDHVDDLAGVMGHEIAHADRRHSVNQLKKQYGLTILTNILLGEESGKLEEIAAALASNAVALSFSRDDESEADAASVEYLDETSFACNGASEFFRRLEAEGSSRVPEFLSTHPDPANRVADIDARASCRGCSTERTTKTINGLTYEQFKALF